MNLCYYGCGREGKYFFKIVKKWCCEKKFQSCPSFKKKIENNCLEKYGVNNISQLKKVKEKMRKRKNIYFEIPIDENILCEYGCGLPARYIINVKNQKFCCSNNYNSCEEMRLINKKLSGIANRNYIKRKTHSELMKKENPMFVDENKQKFINVVSSYDYKEKMSNILVNLWKNEDFIDKVFAGRIKNGVQIPPEKAKGFKQYHNRVFYYTRKTIRKHINIINPDNKPIGISEGLYNIDHIYSIFDGFNNNINPKIIGSIINLQIILWKDNLKKQRNSWITKEELYERYEEIEDI